MSQYQRIDNVIVEASRLRAERCAFSRQAKADFSELIRQSSELMASATAALRRADQLLENSGGAWPTPGGASITNPSTSDGARPERDNDTS